MARDHRHQSIGCTRDAAGLHRRSTYAQSTGTQLQAHGIAASEFAGATVTAAAAITLTLAAA
jgi:hypothetical protein